MNKFIGIGRLTKDPELRYTQSEKAVASFDIAINRAFKNKDGEKETDFFKVVIWNKQAENCKKYLTKGSQVAIEGELQNRSYENDKGEKRYITEIIASSIEFLTPKSNEVKEEIVESEVKDEDEPFKEFGDTVEIADEDLAF